MHLLQATPESPDAMQTLPVHNFCSSCSYGFKLFELFSPPLFEGIVPHPGERDEGSESVPRNDTRMIVDKGTGNCNASVKGQKATSTVLFESFKPILQDFDWLFAVALGTLGFFGRFMHNSISTILHFNFPLQCRLPAVSVGGLCRVRSLHAASAAMAP